MLSLGDEPCSTWARSAPKRPRLALAPVVDEHLVHDVGQRQLHRAHRAVGDDERGGRDPLRAQDRLGRGQARGLDHDVGAAHRLLDRRRRRGRACRAPPRSRAPNASRDSGRALVTRISSRSSTWSSSTTLAKAVPRAPTWPSTFAPGRARWRAPSAVTAPVRHSVIAVASRIARGTPVRGSNSVSSASSDGQAELVVVHVVADDLHAGHAERRDIGAQEVEVAVEGRVGDEVLARLEHDLARALRAQRRLDGAEHGRGRARARRRRARRGSGSRWRSPAALWQRAGHGRLAPPAALAGAGRRAAQSFTASTDARERVSSAWVTLRRKSRRTRPAGRGPATTRS